MRKIKLTVGVAVIIISVLAFFYNTIWFWISEPKLSQMQVLALKWPWILIFIAAYLLGLSVYVSEKSPQQVVAAVRGKYKHVPTSADEFAQNKPQSPQLKRD